MSRSTHSKRRRLAGVLAIAGVTAVVAAAPAQPALDEGGGAAQPSPTVQVRVEGFDWSDAGVGIGIGAAAGAVAVGTALVVRRHRIAPHDAARPAAR
jgi:hypothetical protein